MKKRLVSSTRSLGVALGLLVLLLLTPATTWAQANLQLLCIGKETCLNGGTSIITSESSPLFDVINQGGSESGTLFLAVLVPNTTASFTVEFAGGPVIAAEESITFTSGHLGDSGNLNESGLKDYEFSALASASAQAPGVTATSFTVYEFNLGSVSCPGGGGACASNIIVGPLPVGSVIVAWLEDNSGNVLDRTPLSESLTVVPEPGTLVLLGSGLILAGGFLRRRLGI